MRFLFLSPIVIVFYSGVCFYIGIRLMGLVRNFFPAVNLKIFWIIFAFLCIAIIAVSLIWYNLYLLRQITFYWMVFLLYMLMPLVLSDFIRLILFLCKKQFNNYLFYTTFASLVLCVLLMVYGSINARTIKTANYNVTLDGLDQDTRIVLISDLHIGAVVDDKWVKRIVNKVNIAQPDIVCLAGDIFDGNINVIGNAENIINELKKIDSPQGVYACLGNHDVDRTVLRGGRIERIVEILNEANITVLQDEYQIIRDNLYIVGRKDARPIGINTERKTAQELVYNLDGVIIVMDHQPAEFPQLEKAGVNLVLSGHTHRGQVFPGNILTYLIYKKAGASNYGHWKNNTMQGIITSGAALWGPIIRIGTNSEIAVINIRRKL